jgi:hypothetical protein
LLGIRTFDFGSLRSVDLSNNLLSGTVTSSSLALRQRRRSVKSLDLSFNGLAKIEAAAFKRLPSMTKLNLGPIL